MKKKQAASHPYHLWATTFKNLIIRVFFPAVLMLQLCGISACKKEDAPPQDPCLSNQNDWTMRFTVQDNDPFDFDMPLFRSGESVHYELSLSPDETNKCPEVHRIQVQLIQHYSPAIGQTSTRVVATLWNEVIDAREVIDFQESFVPPPGAGTYTIVAIVRDEQGNALMSRASDFFHVQQKLDPKRPVFIAFNSPYHGQVVQRGTPLHFAYGIESVTNNLFQYRVEILNEDNEVIRVITKNDLENEDDIGGVGDINTNTPGKYTIRAMTFDFDPSTLFMHINAASNEFTIVN